MFDFSSIIIIFIVISIITVIGKIVWWYLFSRTVYNAYKTYQNVYNYYNAAAENMLRQLAWAIQTEQHRQAEQYQREIRQQLQTMNIPERKEYEEKLSAVVSNKMKLNPATGEWEHRR